MRWFAKTSATTVVCALVVGLLGCDVGPGQAELEQQAQAKEEAAKKARAAEEEAARAARERALQVELLRLERQRQEDLKKVEAYEREQELLARRQADLAALEAEARRLNIAPSSSHRRGTGVAVAPANPTHVPPVVDAQHLLYAERCDKTLRVIEELQVAVQMTIADMRRRSFARPSANSTDKQGYGPSYYRLQLEKFYGFQDTLELLTANIKNLRSQAHRMDNMTHLDSELMNRIRTLQTVKDSIPNNLVAAAEHRAARAPRPVARRPVAAPKPPEPRKPKKAYTLKDGRKLHVLSEIRAGDEVIVKTTDGKILNIKKDDIEKEEKIKTE